MVLTVHHLGHSQSERVVWLCEELGIEYELKKYDRAPVMAPPEYQALHPLGAAPTITDGDVVLGESQACVDWIINKHGNGRLAIKPDDSRYADFLYWYNFTNGSFQPNIGRLMTCRSAGADMSSLVPTRMLKKHSQILDMLNERLETRDWLVGDEFTAADCMIVFSLAGFREYFPYDLSPYAHILAYLQRVAQREGLQRALQKGDPDVDFQSLIQGEPPLPFKALRK
ncbi:glutathione S-transferase [Polychaeton citri CBS 116435]|uniref:Glutathione S-transferase n=1 Tax=Polychaeton citri CBS 116435 TaxID=1314669 RepID=A0A9P4Q177_9PEZI|nr:glutathione S-transferase [Polychaeton citri CBS 116435]